MAKRRAAKAGDLSYIAGPLRAMAVPIASVLRDPHNPNAHPPASIDAIAASLAENGQLTPIVVNANTKIILSGNGRHAAAEKLGWTHIAALVVPFDSIRAARYALADNRSAEFSEWDLDNVAMLRDALAKEDQWSDFDDLFAMSELMAATEDDAASGDGDPGDPPEPPAPMHEVIVKFGTLDDAEKLFRRLHKQRFDVSIKTL